MFKKEIYVSVDIEASGPIPEEYSMLSLGAAVVGDTSKIFYKEFKPINDNYVPRALEICGLSMEKLKKTGVEPKAGMLEFKEWINNVSKSKKPVFTAFSATFDWMFVEYYFRKYVGRNPFGLSGLDIKAYYMGKFGTKWVDTAKRRFDKRFLSKRKHTHNALDDAIEQAEIFEKLLEYKS